MLNKIDPSGGKVDDPKGAKVKMLRQRHRIFSEVRGFFDAHGFTEVHTPLLVKNPGLEPYLVPFQTELLPGMGSVRRETLYLPTSPEYHLKKALALGLDRIFEITRSFRNGEMGRFHEPEFHMLEWYRAPGSYKQIADDAAALIALLARSFDAKNLASWTRVEHLSVRDAFERFARVNLDEALSAGANLSKLAVAAGISSVQRDDDFDTAFGKIMVEKIEPKLGFEGLTFLWDYPASQAALARISPENPNYAQRFELYWRGVELANAFQELTDAQEQRKRCCDDQAKRQELYGSSPPLDEDFLAALERLPDNTAGIALGLDRLIQCLLGAASLQEVLAFPHRSSV